MNDPRRPELVIPASARTSLPPLPTFVEHGGELACRHPADAINTRLYGFVLQADRELLDAYCDRCFNRPTGDEEHWQAAGDEVLLNRVRALPAGRAAWREPGIQGRLLRAFVQYPLDPLPISCYPRRWPVLREWPLLREVL